MDGGSGNRQIYLIKLSLSWTVRVITFPLLKRSQAVLWRIRKRDVMKFGARVVEVSGGDKEIDCCDVCRIVVRAAENEAVVACTGSKF